LLNHQKQQTSCRLLLFYVVQFSYNANKNVTPSQPKNIGFPQILEKLSITDMRK
jgi:hypothetical protein